MLPPIIDTTVKAYDDPKILDSIITHMCSSITMAQSNFIDTLIKFVEDLNNFKKSGFIKTTSPFSTNIIISQIKSKPKMVLDMFIIHVYSTNDGLYREKILSGDDSYFLDKDIPNSNILLGGLKDLQQGWSTIPNEIKEIIKMYLMMLTEYSDIKYINYNRYQMIKHINNDNKENKHMFDKFDLVF